VCSHNSQDSIGSVLHVVETRRAAVDTCSWLTHQVVLSKSIRNLFLTFICENNCLQA